MLILKEYLSRFVLDTMLCATWKICLPLLGPARHCLNWHHESNYTIVWSIRLSEGLQRALMDVLD